MLNAFSTNQGRLKTHTPYCSRYAFTLGKNAASSGFLSADNIANKSFKDAIAATGILNCCFTSSTADNSPCPFSILSKAIATPATVAFAFSIHETDSRTEVPAEITSSIISTRPANFAPTITPPSPWSLASLRL